DPTDVCGALIPRPDFLELRRARITKQIPTRWRRFRRTRFSRMCWRLPKKPCGGKEWTDLRQLPASIGKDIRGLLETARRERIRTRDLRRLRNNARRFHRSGKIQKAFRSAQFCSAGGAQS